MSNPASIQTSFIADFFEYVGRVRQFEKNDWIVYILWVGLMSGLLFSTAGFVLLGHSVGVQWEAYVWNVPVGTFIFVAAIAIDTIGHRTIYKEALSKGEYLVHGITIFAGITSCILLCLAWTWPSFMKVPALTFIILSIFYSIIDEAMHWHRYMTQKSDRVEMWSHFFIFVGHLIMILSWWHWFTEGYPGVAQTVQALPF